MNETYEKPHTKAFDLSEWIDNHKILTLIINLVGVGLLFFLFHPNSDQNNSNAASPSPTTVEESQVVLTSTPTPTKPTKTGLNISRDTVINGLHKVEPSIVFTQGVSIKGEDNYTASKGQNIIQLIGPKDNLTEISSTALLDNSGNGASGNLDALVYVIGVASVADGDSRDWITSAMTEVRDSWANGETSVKRSQVINGNKFQLDAEKTSYFNSVSLTIDPSN